MAETLSQYPSSDISKYLPPGINLSKDYPGIQISDATGPGKTRLLELSYNGKYITISLSLGGGEEDKKDRLLSIREAFGEPKSATVEAMKNPGYSTSRIDTNTLNIIENFGLSIKNGKDQQGKGIVEFNTDKKFIATLRTDNGKAETTKGGVTLDEGTKTLVAYSLREDGYNNPNAPLRLKSINTDGTTDYITFEKIETVKNTYDLADIYPIDTITTYEGKSRKEEFPSDTKGIFENAKKQGIQLEWDGSRSNGISIIDRNGNSLGKVRVFGNMNWKNELVTKIKDITSSVSNLSSNQLDQLFQQGKITPKKLMTDLQIRKSLYIHWSTVSDTTVLEVKKVAIEYAKAYYPNSPLAQKNPSQISIRIHETGTLLITDKSSKEEIGYIGNN